MKRKKDIEKNLVIKYFYCNFVSNLKLMPVNKKIFELETLLNTYTYSKVMEHYNSLLEIEKELQEEEIESLKASDELEQAITAIGEIEEQLDYLNKNISVFRDALLILENECFNRITTQDIQFKFCLN